MKGTRARYVDILDSQKEFIFKPFPALERRVTFTPVANWRLKPEVIWKSSATINLPRFQQNAKEELKSRNGRNEIENAIGPSISIAVNIF